MIVNDDQWALTIDKLREFQMTLDFLIRNPHSDSLKQRAYEESLLIQIERFKEELTEYERKRIR